MVTLYELGVELNFLVGNSNKKVVCMAESSKEMEALESNDISFREYENVALEFISLKKVTEYTLMELICFQNPYVT